MSLPQRLYELFREIVDCAMVQTQQPTSANMLELKNLLNQSWPVNDVEMHQRDLVRGMYNSRQNGFINYIFDNRNRVSALVLWTESKYISKYLALNGVVHISWDEEHHSYDVVPYVAGRFRKTNDAAVRQSNNQSNTDADTSSSINKQSNADNAVVSNKQPNDRPSNTAATNSNINSITDGLGKQDQALLDDAVNLSQNLSTSLTIEDVKESASVMGFDNRKKTRYMKRRNTEILDDEATCVELNNQSNSAVDEAHNLSSNNTNQENSVSYNAGGNNVGGNRALRKLKGVKSNRVVQGIKNKYNRNLERNQERNQVRNHTLQNGNQEYRDRVHHNQDYNNNREYNNQQSSQPVLMYGGERLDNRNGDRNSDRNQHYVRNQAQNNIDQAQNNSDQVRQNGNRGANSATQTNNTGNRNPYGIVYVERPHKRTKEPIKMIHLGDNKYVRSRGERADRFAYGKKVRDLQQKSRPPKPFTQRDYSQTNPLHAHGTTESTVNSTGDDEYEIQSVEAPRFIENDSKTVNNFDDQSKTDKSDSRVKSSDKQADSSKTKQRWADVDE